MSGLVEDALQAQAACIQHRLQVVISTSPIVSLSRMSFLAAAGTLAAWAALIL